MKVLKLPKGFSAAGIDARIKKSKKTDLGIIYSEKTCSMAGFYTKNKLKCAHILHAKKNSGKKSVILANSGCANAFTGRAGIEDLGVISKKVSAVLDIPQSQIIFASTGIIGKRLPFEKIVKKIPSLVSEMKKNSPGKFAESIMTTDLVEKYYSKSASIGGKKVIFSIVAKGSGMIAPDMATMLAFLMTDADISSTLLKAAAKEAIEKTFNRVTVDGDMSPNDTVYVLANGMAGNRKILSKGKDYISVKNIITELFMLMAQEMAKDGEGATKFIKITVANAKSIEGAKKIALRVANSLLVKTAFFGEGLNMGRIVSAVSSSGAEVVSDKIVVKINGHKSVDSGKLIKNKKLFEQMKKRDIDVFIDIKLGSSGYYVFTTDLSYDYVRINADYS